jgi:muramoyltetrapeptide carboxypeptidase LdcA involved in peptidoglycan recycling
MIPISAHVRANLPMNLIVPKRLQRGDTLATISLSWGGAGMLPHRYETGVQQLEEAFGVRVIPTRHALCDAAWLAQNPQARADDLMEALSNPNIGGIISNIGGEDSIRTLKYLDLKVIHDHPKVFMGYSDTTITHMAFYKAGVRSYYGPAILSGFAENGGLHDCVRDSVERTLFSSDPIGGIFENTHGWTVEKLDWFQPELQSQKRKLEPCTGWQWIHGSGVVEGRLIGGCFEVFDWLRGTEYWPELHEWNNAILFLETSEDMPSPVSLTYFLRALAATDALEKIGAILLGRPGGQMAHEKFVEYDQAILQVVKDEEHLEIPVVTHMDFGHTDPMFVMPYGMLVRVDATHKTLEFLEGAVT